MMGYIVVTGKCMDCTATCIGSQCPCWDRQFTNTDGFTSTAVPNPPLPPPDVPEVHPVAGKRKGRNADRYWEPKIVRQFRK